MFRIKSHLINASCRIIYSMRLDRKATFFAQRLNHRAFLKLSGPDTNNYLQSMITNDMKNIEDSPAIFSLLLNSRGRVLYDILLYKTNEQDYFVEYESSAVEYLQKHLLMYRLRKNVNIELVKNHQAWVVYSESESCDPACLTKITDSLTKQDSVITSVIDPRTNLLGVRAVTEDGVDLLSMLNADDLEFEEGASYRLLRYKLGIGEGVMDHPPGVCLPLDTNVDFLNGVSFSKGCYIGQELTARLHFTLNVKKRLMPVVLEAKENYPDFPPECSIVNDKSEKLGRLRSHLGQYGLALLKFEESLKAKNLFISDFNMKLEVKRPKWWPSS